MMLPEEGRKHLSFQHIFLPSAAATADIRAVSQCVNLFDDSKNLLGNFRSLRFQSKISHIHPAKLQSIVFSAIFVVNGQLL